MKPDERVLQVLCDLPKPVRAGETRRYGADENGRRRSAFDVTAAGEPLVEVMITPRGPQEQADAFAAGLRALLWGSEWRAEDAEARLKDARAALERKEREVSRLRDRLVDFEAGRAVRGEAFALESETGGVWLTGRPTGAAFGFWYRSWADLARERPGWRPCGTRKSEEPGHDEVYVVMRPIADLQRIAAAAAEVTP